MPRLSDALNLLATEDCSSDDRIAWAIDLAVLAMEHARPDGASASLGAHERHFRGLPGGGAVADAIASLRVVRERIDLRVSDPEDVAALLACAASVLDATGAHDAPYVRRVSYDARLVNALTLETPHGLRSFHLLHGNALAPATDVLVVPSNANADGTVEGQVVSALRWRWRMPVTDPGPLLRLPGGGWASWVSDVPAEAPFRGLLLLRTPSLRADPDPLERFGEHLRGTFASLAALAYLGHPVRTVTLPMIAGNHLDELEGRAAIMLREVTRWLRTQASADLVQAVVFFADELATWDEAMNRVLGRSYVGPGQDAVLDGLHKDVLARLGALRSAAIAGGAQALRHELVRGDGRLGVHAICVFGRKLAEEMVGDLLRRHNVKPNRDLFDNIQALSKAGVISPWVASYMHGLRVLGNESVHSRDGELVFAPRAMGKADAAQALAAVRALLEAWPC